MKTKLIIRTIILLSLILFSIKLQAQTNIVKGRLFALPGTFNVFSIGIGYEKMISSNKSIQILYNRYGYDMRGTDGSSETLNSIVPEYRIYFGKQLDKNFNKCAFIGVFNEFTFSKVLPSGEGFEEEFEEGAKNLRDRKKIILSPGILIGKNFFLSKKLFLDVYAGIKYRFINQESRFYQDQIEIIEKSKSDKIGIRMGLNLGYKF